MNINGNSENTLVPKKLFRKLLDAKLLIQIQFLRLYKTRFALLIWELHHIDLLTFQIVGLAVRHISFLSFCCFLLQGYPLA